MREFRIEEDHPYLVELNRVWTDQLVDAVQQLPALPDDVLAGFD